MRNTFGRVSGSMICRPPSKTTPTGISAPWATGQDASMPVPSSTTAIACVATARRMLTTARAGERAVSIVTTRRSYVVPAMGMPPAFTSLAASRAPFSIVRPRYGDRENGALTTIVNMGRSVAFEVPPQPASVRTATQRIKMRATGRVTLEGSAAQVGGTDGRVGGDGVGRSVSDHASCVEHDDPIGETPHDAEIVLDDEECESLGSQ